MLGNYCFSQAPVTGQAKAIYVLSRAENINLDDAATAAAVLGLQANQVSNPVQAGVGEFFPHTPDIFIHRQHHRVIGLAFLVSNVAEFLEPVIGRVHRGVNGVEGEVKKPRLLRLRCTPIKKTKRGLRLHNDAEPVVRHEMRSIGERLVFQIMRCVELPYRPAEVFGRAG